MCSVPAIVLCFSTGALGRDALGFILKLKMLKVKMYPDRLLKLKELKFWTM